MELGIPESQIADLIKHLEAGTCPIPPSESLHVTPGSAAAARSKGIELKRVGDLEGANEQFVEMFRLQDSICSDALWSWAKVLLLAKDFRHAQLVMHAEFANNNRGIDRFNPFEWMNLHLNLPELDVDYLYDGSRPGYELYGFSYFDDPLQLVDRIAEYGGNDDYWKRAYSWDAEDYAEFALYFSALSILVLSDELYLWTDDAEEDLRERYDRVYGELIDAEKGRAEGSEDGGLGRADAYRAAGPASEGSEPQRDGEASLRVAEAIEECFYYNAMCLGNCVFIAKINDRDQWYPEQFCDFLYTSAGLLAEDLERLLETTSGRGVRWRYPDDFERVFGQKPSQDLHQYIVDVGKHAFFREAGAVGSYGRYPATYLRTTDMAINRCLSLLRVASEENAHDVMSVMLEGKGYMLGIASHFLLLQGFLRSMHRPNDAVFIPDKYLDPYDACNRTLLRTYDQDISESSQMVYVPGQLHPMWVEDGARTMATGHVMFMGMPGMLFGVSDKRVPEHFDVLVQNFVRGIVY